MNPGEEGVAVGHAVATAVTYVWLGMVVAISFVEAPLKFRAPGVSLAIGLGIGRLVFRALNTAEAVFAVVVLVTVVTGALPYGAAVAEGVAIVALGAQLATVRPRLTRRSDLVMAGHEAPRSHAHHAYIALEAVKVVALLTAGVLLLS
ncbi:hypothetical protein [Streptosporangium saharense]|uniref:Transmembrane protein n=1 Tax=Streptosporangium saharense TaxID=1706840 RepID=A0A7W7QHH6_9ACTN|nr:hypothetical protein [Streptosporangium saharense]MBB4913474.1 hypothetical protein [Streptosporangium saharense]